MDNCLFIDYDVVSQIYEAMLMQKSLTHYKNR